ncbi:hypothetical protein [Pedobacter sp. V48]|uniref:hypothetical protein n=1 Tax=Pedobacter sp. V48 TaxID=509635 RepID=UPI0003E47F59|nr:hypothetical protein [Pedobacter sp. V48]ETZ21824.1 hypothetical protein N824_26670 [Pedobacter sp. V48]
MQHIKLCYRFIKVLMLIGVAIYPLRSLSQNELSGCYRVYANTIHINPDSTFRYIWRFDLIHEWATGRWSVENDTIYFKMIPVYDTLIYSDENGIKVTKVVLSDDEKQEIIAFPLSKYPFNPNESMDHQGGYYYPKKLLFRNNKLYEINTKGKLIKKKYRGFMTRKDSRHGMLKLRK